MVVERYFFTFDYCVPDGELGRRVYAVESEEEAIMSVLKPMS